MNLLLATILLAQGYSQLIKLTLCTDNGCSDGCLANMVNADTCYSCNIYHCKASVHSLTFYSDAACNNALPAATDMTLFFDSGCKTLYGANEKKFGSYKASNVSALIGGIVGGSAVFVGFYVMIFYLYTRLRRREKVSHLVNEPEEPRPVNSRLINNPFYIDVTKDYFTRSNKPNAIIIDLAKTP